MVLGKNLGKSPDLYFIQSIINKYIYYLKDSHGEIWICQYKNKIIDLKIGVLLDLNLTRE